MVRTVWIQQTGASAYVQRHLPTGGVELHLPIGSDPQLARIKRVYDPDRLFDFPQRIEPDTQEDS